MLLILTVNLGITGIACIYYHEFIASEEAWFILLKFLKILWYNIIMICQNVIRTLKNKTMATNSSNKFLIYI